MAQLNAFLALHIIFGLILQNVILGNYFINDDKISSYLSREFDDIKEEIFPRDLRINISMSKIAGTLLYSIDRNMNQLIISLPIAMYPSVLVEFNKHEYTITLSALCGCDRCQYTILDLRIRITSVIGLNCNNGDLQTFQLNREKKLNDNYPNPFKNKKGKLSGRNRAYLWIVNTPHFKELYPNSAQLSGCIFHVSYNHHPVIFTEVTSNIDRTCNKTCAANICYGGQCLESYNRGSVCDCTNTFKNGPYCNDELRCLHVISHSKKYIFNMIKLSWRSSSKSIIILANRKIELRLYHEANNLVFGLVVRKKYEKKCQVTLSNQYNESLEYIAIVQFKDISIDIKWFSNGAWNRTSLLSPVDLKSEIFENLELYCANGYYDIVYKNSPLEFVWKNIVFEETDRQKPESLITRIQIVKPVTPKSNSGPGALTIVTYVILAIVILALLLVITICYQRYRNSEKWIQKYRKMDVENITEH